MEEHLVVHKLLTRLLKDDVLGRKRSLEEYQALFPGHEELVARHHARYHGEAGGISPAAETVGPSQGPCTRLTKPASSTATSSPPT